jgi:hypothetical protein
MTLKSTSHLGLTLTVALLATGCKKSSDTSAAEAKAPSPEVAPTPAVQPETAPVSAAPPAAPIPVVVAPAVVREDFKMPKVKYAGAIVFEGGIGNPWTDDDGQSHKVLWRSYICLEQTKTQKSGTVEFDLQSLETPYETSWTQEGRTIVTRQLQKVVLHYTYTANIKKHQDKYAWGEVTFSGKSDPEWMTTYLAPGEKDSSAYEYPIELFNSNYSPGSLGSFSMSQFKLNGESYYISSYLNRFTFDKDDRKANVMTPCEEQDEPYVFDVGRPTVPRRR